MPHRRLEALAYTVLLFAALVACKDGAPSDNRPPGPPPHVAAEQAVSVAVPTLIADYKGNEVRGDAKWKGKLVKTAGVVNGITKDITDDAHVQLGGGGALEVENVDCEMRSDQVAAVGALTKGQRVVLRGRVTGLMMLSVMLKDCEVVLVKDGR